MPSATDFTFQMLTSSKQPALESTLLPSGNDSDLVLEVATAAENEHASRLNADEWKGPLSEVDYFAREKFLMTGALVNKGQQTAWILTSSKLPLNADGTRPILSCCETIVKTAYVAQDGQIRKIRAHGICSVFCRPEYRGKGYAGRMIAELGKKLETFQQPDGSKGMLSVLYSDIGPKFYARYGWLPFPSTHITLPPREAQSGAGFQNVRDLESADLLDIPIVQNLEESLRMQSAQKPDLPIVAFQPSHDQMRWHHMREEFLCDNLGKPFPAIKGVLHVSTGIVMLWTRIFSGNPSEYHLNVLHIAIPSRPISKIEKEEALTVLLQRAQHEAYQWDMQEGVEVWSPSESVFEAAKKLRLDGEPEIEIVSRDKDHICSLKWNGPEKEVVWAANEKYAWC